MNAKSFAFPFLPNMPRSPNDIVTKILGHVQTFEPEKGLTLLQCLNEIKPALVRRIEDVQQEILYRDNTLTDDEHLFEKFTKLERYAKIAIVRQASEGRWMGEGHLNHSKNITQIPAASWLFMSNIDFSYNIISEYVVDSTTLPGGISFSMLDFFA